MLNQPDHQDNLLSSVLEIIHKIAGKLADSTYIYRGEPERYPKICSSLYLEYQDIETNSFDIETVQMEILAQAKNYTDEVNDFKILMDIQRYGGKTNLIEFTTDYLIALFFACNGSPDKDGRIILQKTEEIKDLIVYPWNPQNHRNVQKIVFVRSPKGFIQPDASDIITIPQNLKQFILEYLQKAHDISTKTIYNDLYGFVMSHSIHQSAYTEFCRGLTWYERGIDALVPEEKQNAFERTIMYYTEVLVLNPSDANTYYNRGLTYFNIGEYDKADLDYSKAIQLKPDNSDAHSSRGLIYFNKGEYDKAIADYNIAIQLKSDNSDAYYNRGLFYFNKGEYDKAIADYNIAIQLKSDNSDAYYNRGLFYFNKGEYDKAIADYNIAIQLKPDNPAFYYNRSLAYHTIGEVELAIADYNKVMELEPHNTTAQAEVKGFLHSMKLRFDETISSEPYYRIFAVPITLTSDAVQTEEQSIRAILQNPSNVRKGAFGFTGVPEIFPISEGISGFNFSGGEVTLLNNGFLELRCPLSNSVFQWQIEAHETFSNSEWLYPYVVCEFPVTFLRLVKAIYTTASITSHILVQQEYHNLNGFLLVGGQPGGPDFGKSEDERRVYQLPYPIVSKQTVNPDFNPDRTAYDFVTDVYTHFRLSTALMPALFDEEHNFVL